ncbi:GNAT family N-acetyltransferase [uncultured Tateyamaria sp.]|uniref:GNAT family N-acetyltransferase n=1 Tax=Tateyamaria sp. 1078 TaxID=3417464 RepID=UPI0026389CB6|nr:GNAT family N-acetyltransferase [uncultured Tateyamaria sp.]
MFPAGFDPQPVLTGRTLHLRPMTTDDRDPLFAAASDPLIWEQHPARNRHERAVFDPYFDAQLARGSALVVERRTDGRVIGTSCYYVTDEVPPAVSIGFTFLERAHWGGATNHEMKTLMLDHIFVSLDTAWLHVGTDNIRSQKATEKLGATLRYQADLDLGNGPARYLCYALPRSVWRGQ